MSTIPLDSFPPNEPVTVWAVEYSHDDDELIVNGGLAEIELVTEPAGVQPRLHSVTSRRAYKLAAEDVSDGVEFYRGFDDDDDGLFVFADEITYRDDVMAVIDHFGSDLAVGDYRALLALAGLRMGDPVPA